MEISFRTQDNIQIVVISGPLGDAEAAAVRVKLEQKINQGRDRVLFDLSDCDLTNDTSQQLLLGILAYCVNRGVLICCCGVPSGQRPRLLIPGPRQAKVFFTLNEGIDFLQKNEPPKPKTRDTTKKTEEDIKTEAISSLLEKYSVFQQNEEEDSFRLKFLADQYKTNPNREALNIERKAWETFNGLQYEIKTLDSECDQMGAKVKALMHHRKVPLSPREAELKQSALAKEVEEMKSAVGKIREEVKQYKSEVEAAKRKAHEKYLSFDQSIKEFERKIAITTETYAEELKNLKAQDAQEQADFEAKIKSRGSI